MPLGLRVGVAAGDAIPLPMRVVHVAIDATLQLSLGGTEHAVRIIRERAGRDVVGDDRVDARQALSRHPYGTRMGGHGVPGERVLKPGDILNIDITVIKDGYHGDCSRMFYVGEPSIQARRLVEVTFECMWLGIRQVRPGGRLGDIGAAIQAHAESHGFSVVREFCGHGIGRKFHEEPQVLHYGKPGTGLPLQAGMTFTVEPMITLGTWQHKMWDDDWTAVTTDGKRTAQFEHTLVVTDDGAEVLTTCDA